MESRRKQSSTGTRQKQETARRRARYSLLDRNLLTHMVARCEGLSNKTYDRGLEPLLPIRAIPGRYTKLGMAPAEVYDPPVWRRNSRRDANHAP